MTYLVDSDVIIDAITGQRWAVDRLGTLGAEELGISIVGLGEILEGIYHFPDPESHRLSIRGFLAGYRVYGVSEAAIDLFARNRALLRQQGQLIPDFDLVIAATALAEDLTLVTRNLRHYSRIPGLRLYQMPTA